MVKKAVGENASGIIEQLNRRGVPWFVARDYGAAVRQLKQWAPAPGAGRPPAEIPHGEPGFAEPTSR